MTQLQKLYAPRIEIAIGTVLGASRDAGPYQVTLILYTSDKAGPETIPLFSGRPLTKEEAAHGLLQIYTSLGDEFQNVEMRGAPGGGTPAPSIKV